MRIGIFSAFTCLVGIVIGFGIGNHLSNSRIEAQQDIQRRAMEALILNDRGEAAAQITGQANARFKVVAQELDK